MFRLACRPMKLLITGACGFVGTAIAQALLERRDGLKLFGIDNLMRPGSELNRTTLKRLGVEFIHGDVRNHSDLDALPACDWVIDAAANPSVLAGVNGSSTSQLFEHNLAGVANVLGILQIERRVCAVEQQPGSTRYARTHQLPRVVDEGFVLDDTRSLPAEFQPTESTRSFRHQHLFRCMGVRNLLLKLLPSNMASRSIFRSGSTGAEFSPARDNSGHPIRASSLTGFMPIGPPPAEIHRL